MSNEMEKPKENNFKKGCLIGCGIIIAGVFGIIILIVLAMVITTSALKSNIKPLVDNFYDKYNNGEYSYICNDLFLGDEKDACMSVVNKMNSQVGKEKDYNLSILKGAKINIKSDNGKTIKSIETTANFEKLDDVEIKFEFVSNKGSEPKMSYFSYHKD